MEWSLEVATGQLAARSQKGLDKIRLEMKHSVKWTPEGLMILVTACDGGYRTEQTTAGKKGQAPTSGRLQNARNTGPTLMTSL